MMQSILSALFIQKENGKNLELFKVCSYVFPHHPKYLFDYIYTLYNVSM